MLKPDTNKNLITGPEVQARNKNQDFKNHFHDYNSEKYVDYFLILSHNFTKHALNT